jgi:AraC-like DNA-binding protein
MLRYERFAPGPALADYVEFLWLVQGPPLAEVRQEILIPNGRPMILLCLGEPGRRVDPRTGEGQLNADQVAGIATGPVIIEQAGVNAFLAAQLRPWGLSAFLPERLLVDETITLADWVGGNAAAALKADVAAAEFGEPAARVLERFLETRLMPLPVEKVRLLRAAVERIEDEPEVELLAKRLGLSASSLYRLFRGHLGISPKQFIAIARYYRLVGGVLGGNFEGALAHLALLEGYYDQAHATRDFRRFTGVSQKQFKTTLNGIAQLMHRA